MGEEREEDAKRENNEPQASQGPKISGSLNGRDWDMMKLAVPFTGSAIQYRFAKPAHQTDPGDRPVGKGSFVMRKVSPQPLSIPGIIATGP